jgi:hypothetical protein
MVRRTISLLGFLASLGAAGTAFGAEEVRVALSLNWMRLPGAESCIDAGELARSVERHLGRPVFVSPAVATRIIEAWVEPLGPGWRVHLRASNANGEPLGQRELTSADATCSSLGRAIVIAVGLLAQEAEGATITEQDQPPVSAPAAIQPRPPDMTPAPVRSDPPPPSLPAPRSELGAEIGPAFDLGWGVLPGTAVGLAMRTAVHLPRWGALDFGSRLWLPQSEGSAKAAGSFSRLDFALALCPFVTATDSTAFGFCAGALGGVVTAQGTGSGGSDTVNRPLLEAYGRFYGLLRVFAPLWVTGSATIGAPLTRWTFYHRLGDGSETDVWAMPAIAAGAELGLLIHFGP